MTTAATFRRIGNFDFALTGRKLWILWSLLVIGVVLVHWLTLSISPTIWQDEVQIVEAGRLLFEPHSNWSADWWVTAHRPMFFWYYLGPAAQELALKITSPSPDGPRLSSILGGVMAATTLVGWLLSHKTPRIASLVLGLIFLLDPLFVQSYRGARVDGWVLAFSVGSCWLISSARNRAENGQSFSWIAALGGGLALGAFFVWASAPLMYPLVAIELGMLLWVVYLNSKSWSSTLRVLTLFIAGATVMALVLIVPIWSQLEIVLHDVRPLISLSQPSTSFSVRIKDLFNTFKFTPLLPIGALIGLTFRRNRWLAVATLITLLYLLSTNTYNNRTLYLLPYMFGLIGGAYGALFQSELKLTNRWPALYRSISWGGLTLMVFWAVGLSLVARPALALSQREGRDPRILLDAARASIGSCSCKVFLGAWEFYYAGRSLGWHIYKPYMPTTQPEFQSLLSDIDYAIFLSADVNADIDSQLSLTGFHLQEKIVGDLTNGIDVRSHDSANPYGPYSVYRR